MVPRPRFGALVRASHPGPTAAVATLTALLAVSAGHSLVSGAWVTLAVGAGQLSIGWSNDLIDASRDRRVGRADKPIARGEISTGSVRLATAAALSSAVVLSLLCGVWAAVVHLVLVVGSGWAYNLGVKRTLLSAVPYAVAFGCLPIVVTLALPAPRLPPLWVIGTGALLGIGAHLLNALPDFADDAATDVRGLPHRLGPTAVRLLAPAVLVTASLLSVFAPQGATPWWAWAALVACAALGVVAAVGRGPAPFRAAVLIALIDVTCLVLRS